MRVGRKSKGIDTVKAQSLTEVARPTPASTPTSAPTSPAIITGERLPLELYGHIISLVDSQSTLRQICLVCEFFCEEGRRRLYNEVHLAVRRISHFARTVVNNPRIARRVRSISITFPAHMVSMNNREGKDIVAILLQYLTELENLDIYGQPRVQLHKLLDVTSPRLKRFRSSAYICQEVIDSLASRPQLRELVIPDSYPHFRPIVPESFLPGLETLCLPMCLIHHVTKMNWGLTRLAINISLFRDLESLVPGIVSHFGETLTNLSLVRLVPTQSYGVCPMIDLISEFAANVPKLRFLTVSVCEHLPPGYIGRIKTTDWGSLKALETLVWFAEDSVDIARHAFAQPMMSQNCVYVGEKFAEAVDGTCTALKTFVFVNESKESSGHQWGKGGSRRELTDVEQYTAPKAWRLL